VPQLVSGHFLTLSEHPRTDWNDLWLITSLHHEGQTAAGTGGVGYQRRQKHQDGFTQGYRNQFSATPWDVPFPPPIAAPKAKVLGKPNCSGHRPGRREIHCDQYGRIKVQFHWDREGQGNDQTSCWLRVSSSLGRQPSNGGIANPPYRHGSTDHLPRRRPRSASGHRFVLPQDSPCPITSSPAHKTRSVFKTLSTAPGGGGRWL